MKIPMPLKSFPQCSVTWSPVSPCSILWVSSDLGRRILVWGHTRPLIGQYLAALTSDWLESTLPIPRQSVCMNRVRSGQNCVQQSGESLGVCADIWRSISYVIILITFCTWLTAFVTCIYVSLNLLNQWYLGFIRLLTFIWVDKEF